MKNLSKLSKGFTLIELLIVIAVLGILAAVVLVAIDPAEQLARGRDAGRKTSVAQLGRALQAYFTQQAQYPTIPQFTNVNTTNQVVVRGEIRSLPNASPIAQLAGGDVPCTGGTQFGLPNAAGNRIFCYKVVPLTFDNAIVYTKMESRAELNKGACAGAFADVWYVYSTQDGRSGTVNSAAQPDTGGAPFTYC